MGWAVRSSLFNPCIEHRAETEMVDVDHISRQTNLPNATHSEEEPYPLDKSQGLVDPTECEQPVSGACGLEECEPWERCALCVQELSQANWQGICSSKSNP